MLRIMARKVFISFLGTGNYVNCKYRFSNEYISEPVRFIQEALIKVLCNDWIENDKILIFCTTEAIRKNWNDNGHVDPDKPNQVIEEIEKIGLESRLRNTKFWDIVSMHQIEDGFSEKEVWNIFDEVYKHLHENDELYFDVTHAFRSIPMFSTILFNYAGFMKRINIKSIHYGAFEKLGTAYKVKKEIPLEERIAPVLNLTNLIRLQQYTDIASSFTTFGRIKKLSKALKDEISETSQIIEDVHKSLENFDNALLTNRISEIEQGKYMLVINNSVKPIKRQNIPTPIKDILNRVREKLTDFGFVPTKSYKNIEAAISWAKHYKMLPQAYTMGQEYIITLISNKYASYSPYRINKDGKKKFRMFISSICSIGDDDVKNRNYKGSLKDNIKTTDLLLKEPIINELRPYFSQLGEKRNSVNHGKGDVDYETFVREFDVLFNKCLDIAKKSFISIEKKIELKSIFLNLTNHPSSLWCDKQLEAAHAYGEIMDMPFPMIDETDNETYISSLADEYLQKILDLAKDNNVTVHLMGELTFTFALLKRLQEYGIPCVASTSKRIVKEESAGRKGEVIFQFERFRRYE